MTVVVLDIGNTRVKAGVYNSGNLVERKVFEREEDLNAYIAQHPRIQHIIVGRVGAAHHWLSTKNKMPPIIEARTDWNLNVSLLYKTPETLGIDRLAGVCAAHEGWKGPCLIFDAGTCLTIDFVDEQGQYLGGNISPGWDLRLQSMAEGTQSLPLTRREVPPKNLGESTQTALQGGGFWGLLYEIKGYITHWERHHKDLNILLTGGNAFELAKHLKLEIFVVPDLVLHGLYHMYQSHYA